MRSWQMRVALVCAMLSGMTAGSASARTALPCADYVSTGAGGPPGVGHLIGTQTVTQEFGVKPGGIGAETSVTFEVGTYDFGGTRIQIDCRDYSRWGW